MNLRKAIVEEIPVSHSHKCLTAAMHCTCDLAERGNLTIGIKLSNVFRFPIYIIGHGNLSCVNPFDLVSDNDIFFAFIKLIINADQHLDVFQTFIQDQADSNTRC